MEWWSSGVVVQKDLITPSLHHSITPSLHHSITPSLHHSITPSLHHSITPSLHHSITPSLHPSITPSLHHSITPSLHHSIFRFRFSSVSILPNGRQFTTSSLVSQPLRAAPIPNHKS